MKKKIIALLLGGTLFISFYNTASAEPKQMKDGTLFDAQYYRKNNPDVVKVYGTNEADVYRHYVEYGKKEGRKPYSDGYATVQTNEINSSVSTEPKQMKDGTLFDAQYYRKNNPDVVKVYGTNETDLYRHYVEYGKKEGRKPYSDAVVTVQSSPTQNANIVSSYETWGAAAKTYRIEQYSNGIWTYKVVEGWEGCDSKYWIMRTDFSDGLLDQDGNGIDDRDPCNSSGYTDLNHNAMADGAPSYEGYTSEEDHTPFWACEHGVINGADICQKQECQDSRARMRTYRIQ